jgi:hypothetical protein
MAFDDTKPTFGTFEDRAVWLIPQLLADFPKWGPLDAYAVCGNLGRESGIQMIQEGARVAGGWGGSGVAGGWGPPQWTGPRRDAFGGYCARSGRDPNSMRTGYAYLFVELKGSFANVVEQVALAPDLPSKVAAFEQNYEKAGIVAMADRLAFAVRAQKAWEAHIASAPATTPAPTTTPPPRTTPATPTPTTTPAPTKGTTMFNIASLISLISQAPTIIESVMKLVTEIEAGYAKGKAAGGDPIVIFEDILAALVANKGAIATAALGNEPKVTANGTIVK